MLRELSTADPTQRYIPKVGKSGAFNDESNPRLTDAALVSLTEASSMQRFVSYFRCTAWDSNFKSWPTPEVKYDASDDAMQSTKSVFGTYYTNTKDAVDVTPMPASLRNQILGSGKRCWRPQTWAMLFLYAVRIAGVASGLYAASMMQGEAVIIRDYGVTTDAMEEDVLGYAYNGWTWLQTSYLITALVSLVEICIGSIFVWGGLRARNGTIPSEVRAWFAASPELEFMPFGVRQIGFFVGDLIFCIGVYATREQLFQQDAYNLNPSYMCLDSTKTNPDGTASAHIFQHTIHIGWPGMFHFYRERMKNTRVPQYIMLVGACFRILNILFDAIVWGGFNSCYILPCARYNTEVFAKRTPADNYEARWEQDKNISISYGSLQKAYRTICQMYESSSTVQEDEPVDPEMYNIVNAQLIEWTTSVQKLSVESSQLFGEDEHNAPEDLQLIESLQTALNEGLMNVPSQIVPKDAKPLASDLNIQTKQLMDLLAFKLQRIGRMIPDRIQISSLYDGPKVMYSGVVLRQECACGGQPCCGRGSSRVCGGWAALAHNYWGALRMWNNVGAIFLFFWVFANASTGIWDGLLSSQAEDNQITWPVYVASDKFNASVDHPFVIIRLPEYFPPPPSPPPVMPLPRPSDLLGVTAMSPPPPPPSPPPPSPPPPPIPLSMLKTFPPETCMENRLSMASSAQGDIAPYPKGLSEDDDASTRMITAATLLFLSEFFRIVGTVAQAIGIIRNEASMPGSHTRRSRKAAETCRSICP